MGLIREQIIGRTLGASRTADLYFASFTLPDFLNYLLAAGALSIVFIPIFLRHLERGDHDRGWDSFSAIANFIVVVGTLGIGLLMIFARPLATLVAPGFDHASEVDILVRLTRIILPCSIFSYHRRPAVGSIAGAKPARPAGDGPAGLFWPGSSEVASSALTTRSLGPKDLPGACWPVRSLVRSGCHCTAA